MIVYLHRSSRDGSLQQLLKPKKGSWIHAVAPTGEELDELAASYDLDRDILVDATDIYEAPRFELDGNKVYIFTRYCYPAGTEIATEPLLVIHTPDNLITVIRQDTNILAQLLDGAVEVTTSHKTKLFLQILHEVNVSYRVQLYRMSKLLLSMRANLRKSEIDNSMFVQFVDLEEDLHEFHAALEPQSRMLRNLLNSKNPKFHEADKDLIEDLTLNSSELLSLTESRLKTISNTREAYATIMANNLNKTFKRLTSISIFMTIPTITAGLYGMNLALPLAGSRHAFWLVLLLVAALTAAAVWLFQRKRWL